MSNNYSTNLRVLIGKLESTPGSAETVTAADFDVRVRNPELSITVEQDDEASKWARGDHGEDESITGAQYATVTFMIKAATATSVTAEPKWWKFAKACGLNSAAWAASGYGLTPRMSKDEQTITLYYYNVQRGANKNGILTVLAGCMGNMVLSAESIGKPWIATFTFTGKIVSSGTDIISAIPNPYGLDASCADRFLMDTVYIEGLPQKVSAFSLDLGNEISPVYDQSDTSGISHYGIISRKPRLSLNPLMKQCASFTGVVGDNAYARLFAGATGCPTTFAMHIGETGQSLKYKIMVPKAQLISSGNAAREGLEAYEQNFRLLANGVTGSVSDGNLTTETTFEILSGDRS